MTADELLSAVRDRYLTINTYQDEGVVLSQIEDEPDVDRILFKTWFRRPNFFRFEWEWRGPREIPTLGGVRTIWSNAKGAFSYDDPKRVVVRRTSLPLTIAGATGVSLGAAHTVAALLMPETGGNTFLQLQRLSLEHSLFDGIRCYYVRGFRWRGLEGVTISKDDLLLRRLDDSSGDVEMRRNIRVNEPIDDTVFEWNPLG